MPCNTHNSMARWLRGRPSTRRRTAPSLLVQSTAMLSCCLPLLWCGRQPFGELAFTATTRKTSYVVSATHNRFHGAILPCGILQATASSSDGAAQAPDFLERKQAVKRCLAREYRSFFRPFEADFYSESVTFKDPLNELAGKDKYRKNVEMLSGESFVGNLLFDRGFIDLHAVEDVPGDERRLRTRWTLGFNFKLLPWQPQALFTGVSEYVIDGNALVVSQRDFWDTLSLGQAGDYSPEAALAGVADLVSQFLPAAMQPEEPPAAGMGAWALLRRASNYRVYRAASGSGVPFAIAAPGAAGLSPSGLEQAVRDTGLVPGSALSVDLESGVTTRIDGPDGGLEGRAVPGVEVLAPNPWDGPSPPE